jgi:hypothetical protein
VRLQQVGVLLFVMYALQCLFGGVIHFVKPKKVKQRPVQNYAHAIMGITVIAVGFYQVRTGYVREWPNAVGRPAPNAINILWYVWAVVSLSLIEAKGMVLLMVFSLGSTSVLRCWTGAAQEAVRAGSSVEETSAKSIVMAGGQAIPGLNPHQTSPLFFCNSRVSVVRDFCCATQPRLHGHDCSREDGTYRLMLYVLFSFFRMDVLYER